jgi:hypothetical protein
VLALSIATLAPAVLAAQPRGAGTGTANGPAAGAGAGAGVGALPPSHAAGTVVALGWSSFTLRIGGRHTSVVRALTAAATAVVQGDYPYVYGGGHAQAGTASIGIKGSGYNGHRVGFDCSGSVGAVLAGAGLVPPGMAVPNDAGIISELRRQKLIARGVGRGPNAVTFWDKPGVHIFMSINGRDFGTSDGGVGNPAQRHGGAGWLDDGAPDASSPAFKAYHLVSRELSATTIYGPTLTFQTGRAYDLLQDVVVGDKLRVGYARGRMGALIARQVAFADGTPVAPAPAPVQ